MKKSLAILVSVCLLVSLLMPVASAVSSGQDDGNVSVGDIFSQSSFVLQRVTCETGSTTIVSLKVVTNPGFCVAVFHLNYDTTALRLCEVSSPYFECDYTTDDAGATVTLLHLEGDVTNSGTVAELSFVSLGKEGVFPVGLSCRPGNVCNAKEEELSFICVAGSVEVSCDHYYVYDHTVEPTCSVKGQIVYTCGKCGSTQITEIDKTAHTPGDWGVTVKPTCDKQGVNAHFCAVCHEVIETTPISALGHTWGDWMIDTPAGCTTKGEKVRVCQVCFGEETAEIAATNHGHSTWKTTDPAGCEVGGTASRVCDDCGAVLETTTLDASGHLMKWVVTKQTTCHEEGVESYLCAVCGKVEQTRPLTKLDHVVGETKVTVLPTCEECGQKETYCEVCGEVIATADIAPVGHVEDRITVVTAPTDTQTGIGEYHCKVCNKVLREEVLSVTRASITAEDQTIREGKMIRIPIKVSSNPGFTAGILRITYDPKNLIYMDITGELVKDLTVGCPAEGQLTILMYTEGSQITKNGVLFYLEFTVPKGADTSTVDITYNPDGDFTNSAGQLKFFNVSGCTVTVDHILYGDLDKDGSVDTADLVLMKRYLAGLIDQCPGVTDVNGDDKTDTTDLTLLKKYLAGIISKLGPVY